MHSQLARRQRPPSRYQEGWGVRSSPNRLNYRWRNLPRTAPSTITKWCPVAPAMKLPCEDIRLRFHAGDSPGEARSHAATVPKLVLRQRWAWRDIFPCGCSWRCGPGVTLGMSC